MSGLARACFLAAVLLGAACAKGAEDESLDQGEGGVGPLADAQPDVATADAGEVDAARDAVADAPGDACTVALAAITFDFEAGAQGWTHGNSDGVGPPTVWPFDPWLQGAATKGTACKSGKCFGTDLTQNYAQCHRGFVVSPPVDLSACKGRAVSLVFQHAYGFWTGAYGGQTWFDGGVVELSGDGTTWQVPTGPYPGTVKINPDRGLSYACVSKNAFSVHNKQGFVGQQAATVRAELVVPPSAITATTRIRFSTAAGVSSDSSTADSSRPFTDFGWRIDDVGFLAK
ncbi:MAG TPA: hypothetical protein VLT33_25050 [Labilithrix sp.]|nr:hypothetical protein [Labilithrix sp.]